MELWKDMLFLSYFQFADYEQIFQETQNSVLQVALVVWGKINFTTHTVRREQGLVL